MVNSPVEQRLRITFRKGAEARFLSHLDLMATLEYAMRRARLPLALSEGFNPRPRFSLASPLALGYIGEREILEITLKDTLPLEEVSAGLGSALPTGIEIVDIVQMEEGAKKAAAQVVAATYRVDLLDPVPDLRDRIDRLLSQATLIIEESRDDSTRSRDLRPLLRSLEAEDAATIRLHVSLSEGGTVRPEHILSLMKIPLDGVLIIREAIELGGVPGQ